LAPAADSQDLSPRHIQGAPLDAGTLTLRDQSWSRRAEAALGSDVIYSNRCDVSYYMGFYPPMAVVDEGRLPSPSSKASWSSAPGCAMAYTITGFELVYCTDQAAEEIAIDFFESYLVCGPPATSPIASYMLTGLPGTLTPGTVTCWTFRVDLSGLPGPPLVMAADGDGSYDGPSDCFGFRLALPLSQGNSGPAFGNYAGHCPVAGGTIWDPVGYDPSRPGIGMGTYSQLYFTGIPQPGCYFTDGTPDYSFYLRLFADACPIGGSGISYCSGDGSAIPCPCANSGQSFHGCANSASASGARLGAAGVASLGQDTLVLQGSSMTNGTVLYFQGTDRMNSGFGTVLGDGLRCAGGAVTRLGTSMNVLGASIYPAGGQPPIHVQGQIAAPGTRTYQAWYRNAAPFCTSATFNLSNGYEVAWLP